VAVRSKAWVCGCSSAGITGSNPANSIDFRPLCVLCLVQLPASATRCSLLQWDSIGSVCVTVIYKPQK
jgi:hypothetical protein